MDREVEWVALLAKASLTLAAAEGLSPAVSLAQLLLSGAGVGGSRMKWKHPGKEAPRCGQPSVTFLGSCEDLPLWFLHQTRPLIGWHEQSKALAVSQREMRARTRAKLARQKAMECIGSWIPDLDPKTSASTGVEEADPSLVIEVNSRIGKPSVKPNEFGRDRLVLLKGDSAYRALERTTGYGPILKRASLNEGAGLRTTLHGWVSAKAFRKIARDLGPGKTRCFGWLISADQLPIADTRSEVVDLPLIGIYQHILRLRYLDPPDDFSPPDGIVELLDRADIGWLPPAWFNDHPLRHLLRADEELAWQLTAVMRLISQEVNRSQNEINEICEATVSLASWIRASHCNEVRLLFPGPPADPSEDVSCKIADKLRLGNQSTRELVRSFHKEDTASVRESLQRMEAEGWVSCGRRDRWHLDLPPLPELSANWSRIANWPVIRQFRQASSH